MTPEKITAGLAIAHLYRRFPSPEFFCVHEASLGVSGPGRTERRADFLALRMWGGGLRAPLGFEVKVSRADFLKEIENPDKRQPMEELCSACYFVAPAAIFRADELPDGWGWLQVTESKLVRRKEARHHATKPSSALLFVLMKRLLDTAWNDRARRPVVVDVTAELFRFAGLDVTPNQLMGEARKMFSAELDKARSDGRAQEALRRSERGRESHEDLAALVNVLTKTLGLSRWEAENPDRLAAVLLAGFNADHAAVGRTMESAQSSLEAIKRQTENLSKLLSPHRLLLAEPGGDS